MNRIITARSHSVPAGRTRMMVSTPDDWRAAQASYLAHQRAGGVPVGEGRIVSTPVEARIDGGMWLIDCECGAGAVVEPAWSMALCMSCGNEYDHVMVPVDWRAMETVLLRRPNQATRHSTLLVGASRVAQSVAELEAENVAHGV